MDLAPCVIEQWTSVLKRNKITDENLLGALAQLADRWLDKVINEQKLSLPARDQVLSGVAETTVKNLFTSYFAALFMITAGQIKERSEAKCTQRT